MPNKPQEVLMSSSKQAQIVFRPRPRSAQERAREERMFRVLIFLTSIFFLPVAALRKLAGLGVTAPAGQQPLSILADAKGMASSIVPFIFMG
jgi:hypothetical protein